MWHVQNHDGRVWLEASTDGRDAVVRVRDNGMGISSEMLPHIFDLFTQEDHTLDHAQGGWGLGLPMGRALIQMHEGTVTAHSAGNRFDTTLVD